MLLKLIACGNGAHNRFDFLKIVFTYFSVAYRYTYSQAGIPYSLPRKQQISRGNNRKLQTLPTQMYLIK